MTDLPIRVQIVTPVHNRKAITLQCLRSLSRIDTTGLEIGTIVVDDGSTDGTGDAIRHGFPNVEVIDGDGNLWFTEGTNVGIRHAIKKDPHFVLLINDDQVFDQSFLRYMIQTARRRERSVVGSLLLLWDTPHRLFQTAPVWNTWQGGWHHWREQTVWTVPEKPWKVELIVGNCLLVPIQAFKEGGLMDSRRYPNFGDAEFTPRLKRLGWQLIIDPRARVFCQPNTAPPRIRKMSLKKMVSTLILDTRNAHNLRRRFRASLDSAPSRLHGITAFMIFLLRAVTGRSLKKGGSLRVSEEPLSATFRSAVIDD